MKPVKTGGVKGTTNSRFLCGSSTVQQEDMGKEAAGIRFQTKNDEPHMENLMHHVNVQTLKDEHERQSRRKATGIDGVTKDEYSGGTDGNLEDLVPSLCRRLITQKN